MADPLARRPEQGSPAKPATRLASTSLQLFVVAALVALVSFFGWRDQQGMATISAVACLGVLIVLRFSSIGKLEMLGLKLENATREAEEAAEEAKATVSQLRSLAATLGKLSLAHVAIRSRLGLLSPRAKLNVRDEVLEALRSAGCTDAELTSAARKIDAAVALDLVDRIAEAIGLPELKGKFTELRGKKLLPPPPASAFRKLLAENNVIDETVMVRLSEYETFERTGNVPNVTGEPGYFDDSVVE